uniref:Uncharacterized protein n=1 Tax=Timema tahoe TaxID=61484 RepID=A0A7R9IRN3_9NEOP|nr:unnamed protein product [Timema tahoe]
MEACDISLVKEEIVEFIKTEPQNEDEFDMCGQSGIKTEDSNMVGDFKDTINYEAQSFLTSEVEMKSSWDGFLPIKEQIKEDIVLLTEEEGNVELKIVQIGLKYEDIVLNMEGEGNEEIVELIKTEPQNEDEFDMCGLSRVKTEVRYQIFLDYEN